MDGNNKVKQTRLIGTTIGNTHALVGKSGKKYCKSAVRCIKSANIFILMAFADLAVLLASIPGGTKVSVSGRPSTNKGDESVIFVDYLTDESRQLKGYQNTYSLENESFEIAEYYRHKSFVPVYLDLEIGKGKPIKKKQYFPKSGCIEVSPGRWQRKIDYAMELVGHEEVTRRLRIKLAESGSALFPPEGRGRDIQKLITEMCEEITF